MEITIRIGSWSDLLILCGILFVALWLDLLAIRDCRASPKRDEWVKVTWTALIVAFPIAGALLYGVVPLFTRDATTLEAQEAELKRRINAGQ
jgi:hypothetical protein